MKTLHLFLFTLLFAQTAPAQIQLEHTYPRGQTWRTRLDVSGEIYAHEANCDLVLSDSLHLEKLGIDIGTNGFSDCGGYLLSEKIIDSDAGVEVLFGWLDDDYGIDIGNAFQDDDGHQVELIGNAFQLSQIPGTVPKLLTGAAVLSIPGLLLEHNYGGSQRRLQRQVFPQGGERYIAYNRDNFDGFHFYNAQHALVKTINLAHPGFNSFDHITQQYFNQDTLFEFLGARWMGFSDANGNRKRIEIVQENGDTLFSILGETYQLSIIPNYSDRLLVYSFSSPQQWQTQMIDPASLQVLHTFAGVVKRQVLPDGEEIFMEDLIGDKVLIYNAQFQLLKTIPLPKSWDLGVTRGQFSSSGKFECFYSFRDAPSPTLVRCTDEDGALLYEFPGASYATIDRQAGMADKFFVNYPNIDSMQVYGFYKTTAVHQTLQETFAATVSPNPFSHSFTIQLPTVGDYTLKLLNTAGQVVIEQNTQQAGTAHINANTLSSGVYWLCIESSDHQRQVLRIVKVN